MAIVLRYRGRSIMRSDITFIRGLIAAHPEASRRGLSKLLCEAWSWRQANGELRDMVCRSLMLQLHRVGEIELPPVRQRSLNNAIARRQPRVVQVDQTPLCGSLSELGSLTFRQVRHTDDEALFDSLIEEHHYLGYVRPVGEHLKCLVRAEGRPIACFTWCSSAHHIGPRDRFIGWARQARHDNIHLLAYNTRFLIVPWVQVPHLASHILSRMPKMLSSEWQRLYRHPIYYLETYVDPTRFRGTCYRAANWIYLGLTTGLGKDSTSNRPTRTKKEVFGYPLHKRFRELLGRTSNRKQPTPSPRKRRSDPE